MCWGLHISQWAIMRMMNKEKKQPVHAQDYFMVGVQPYTRKQKKDIPLPVAS